MFGLHQEWMDRCFNKQRIVQGIAWLH